MNNPPMTRPIRSETIFFYLASMETHTMASPQPNNKRWAHRDIHDNIHIRQQTEREPNEPTTCTNQRGDNPPWSRTHHWRTHAGSQAKDNPHERKKSKPGSEEDQEAAGGRQTRTLWWIICHPHEVKTRGRFRDSRRRLVALAWVWSLRLLSRGSIYPRIEHAWASIADFRIHHNLGTINNKGSRYPTLDISFFRVSASPNVPPPLRPPRLQDAAAPQGLPRLSDLRATEWIQNRRDSECISSERDFV